MLKMESPCCAPNFSVSTFCTVKIDTGGALNGTILLRSGKRYFMNLSISDVRRRTGTTKYVTSLNMTGMQISLIRMCETIGPTTSTFSLVARFSCALSQRRTYESQLGLPRSSRETQGLAPLSKRQLVRGTRDAV